MACSRSDLRIQLSVRKDWQSKINEEATTTFNAGKRHFIYVTNRQIRDVEWHFFLANSYKQKGEVDISLCDLNKISTTLALPGNIHIAYERLGVIVDKKISATPKEIALSNVLLYSNEAKDLRQNIIESNIKAELFKSKRLPAEELIKKVSMVLPGVDIEHNVRNIFNRLYSKSDILNKNGQCILSDEQNQIIGAAEKEYLQSIKNEIDVLVKNYNLDKEDARKLIDITLEIMAKEGALDGDGIKESDLAEFISNKGLVRKKNNLYEDLSKLSIPRIKQYGKTLDHIFSADTFYIFRALGQNSNIVMLLDSSVAMPLMFGLSLGSTTTRYGIAAAVLNDLCKKHNIKLKVPRCYLNEMASHGLKALEFIEIHDILDGYTREILKSSGNAYISHFSNIKKDNSELTLLEFLSYFKIKRNSSSRLIENSIESILATFEIGVIPDIKYDPKIRETISDEKPKEASVIIDHDAIVCTLLKNDSDIGYIFATWDKVIINIVEGLTRIFADTPSRVIDFLSMAGGAQYENEQSFNLLTSLIYIDEKKVAPLANKIEQIKTVDKAYKLKNFIDDARLKNVSGNDIENNLEDFFAQEAEHLDSVC